MAVGSATGRRSVVWSFYSQKNEVYALHRTTGHIEKMSFHSSGICRRAFIGKHHLVESMPDRVLERWTRAKTPPCGLNQGVAVLSIIYPEGHLSYELKITSKKVLWLSPPTCGQARIIQLFFTQEAQADINKSLSDIGEVLLAYHRLPNGESIAIRTWINDFEQKDLILEQSRLDSRHLTLPAQFEFGLRRPVGCTLYIRKEEMRCLELSGYWINAAEGRARYPNADRISNREVIDRGDDALTT